MSEPCLNFVVLARVLSLFVGIDGANRLCMGIVRVDRDGCVRVFVVCIDQAAVIGGLCVCLLFASIDRDDQ